MRFMKPHEYGLSTCFSPSPAVNVGESKPKTDQTRSRDEEGTAMDKVLHVGFSSLVPTRHLISYNCNLIYRARELHALILLFMNHMQVRHWCSSGSC